MKAALSGFIRPPCSLRLQEVADRLRLERLSCELTSSGFVVSENRGKYHNCFYTTNSTLTDFETPLKQPKYQAP